MMFCFIKSRIIRVVLGFLPLFVILSVGCATTHRIYSSVMPDHSGLKKRILVLPILDQAALGEERIKGIESILISALTKDGNVVVVAPSNPGASPDRSKLPRHGIVIDPEQAKKADQMGMNVLITAFISPVDFSSRKWGIWPFRKVKHEGEISMVINAFDVITGTLFLSHIESRKIKAEIDFDEGEQDGQAFKPEIDERAAEKALNQIVQDQASAVSKALKGQPWSGRILSTGSQGFTISAGKDVGLNAGTLFEVFGMGEPIRSADGTVLVPLGIKVGEVKVKEVMESRALAEPISDGLFSPGQVIRVKS
jgi:hypothetical protein